jgi:hypothetical protein
LAVKQLFIVGYTTGELMFSQPMPADQCFERAIAVHEAQIPGVEAAFCIDPSSRNPRLKPIK